jgi:para-nitrobenzyl esterase
VFRGIPYAQPPLGSLRFRPPLPPVAWSGVRQARRFGATAPQSGPATRVLRGISPPVTDQSEDCLTLNVWTPGVDGRRRPVMVWIHGGAFVLGTGSSGLYTGARLASEGDVVVVTLNYRLGALGFLDLRAVRPGDEDAFANLGLLDQIAALVWVRENIQALGGSPENVTIFGESAGGMSVGALLGTPKARGLFHRAICQSGAAHHVSSKDLAARLAKSFLEELGLGAERTEALGRVPARELVRAQQTAALALRLPLGTLAWQPSIDGDVLPRAPLDEIAAGGSAGVPLLIGTNRDEWKLFLLADRKARRMDAAGLRKRLERTLAHSQAADAERAFETYRLSDAERSGSAAWERWAAFQGDRVFHAPALRLAERQAPHADTWSYLFRWSLPLLGRRVGACHGLEIPFVFGSLRDPWLRPWMGATRAARGLSRRMQRAWIEFARTGDPGHDGLPAWPCFEAERRPTLGFDSRCTLRESPFSETLPFWEGVV